MDVLTHTVSKAGEISDYSVQIAHNDLEVCINEIRTKTTERFGRNILKTNIRANIDISGENLLESLKNGVASAPTSFGGPDVAAQAFVSFASSLLKFSRNASPRLNIIPDEQKCISYLTEGFKEKLIN